MNEIDPQNGTGQTGQPAPAPTPPEPAPAGEQQPPAPTATPPTPAGGQPPAPTARPQPAPAPTRGQQPPAPTTTPPTPAGGQLPNSTPPVQPILVSPQGGENNKWFLGAIFLACFFIGSCLFLGFLAYLVWTYADKHSPGISPASQVEIIKAMSERNIALGEISEMKVERERLKWENFRLATNVSIVLSLSGTNVGNHSQIFVGNGNRPYMCCTNEHRSVLPPMPTTSWIPTDPQQTATQIPQIPAVVQQSASAVSPQVSTFQWPPMINRYGYGPAYDCVPFAPVWRFDLNWGIGNRYHYGPPHGGHPPMGIVHGGGGPYGYGR